MNLNILTDILATASLSSLIATQTIQYIKDNFKIVNHFVFIVVNFMIGFLFSISFTDLCIVISFWCGFVVIIGAEALYKIFKGKLGLKSSNSE